MIPIANPFKTDIDVTDKTPVDQIPDSYYANMKPQFQAQNKFYLDVQNGIAELSLNPAIEDFILNEIHLSVSRLDDHIIKTVFHAAISAFASPLNIALKAESGSGKSYSTVETIKFIPPENVMTIGSDSPKVFSHLNGVRKVMNDDVEVNFDDIPEPQKPDKSDYPNSEEYSSLCQRFREDLKAYQKLKEESFYEVDLRNKIIVYLESINPDTFKMLKATMSHDGPYIDHRWVDDKGKVHVTRLIGAPVLIFNSLDAVYMSEFATRTLTLSPVTSSEKIEDAMRISERKSCYPWLFDSERLNKTIVQAYLRKVRDTLQAGKIKTLNVFEGMRTEFSKRATRDMRDFNKFLELMPSYAMVKLFQRPIVIIGKQRYLIPTFQDFLDAKAVFDSVSETTKTGTEQRIISFYWDHVAEKVNGRALDGTAVQITMEEMTEIIKGGEPFKTAQVFKTETVTEQSTEPKNIAICENAQVSNPIQTLFYRRLTPNETFKCDGESCSLLAQYEMIDSDPNNTEKPHYCESHFLLTRKGCSDNGFILKELEPQKISFRATQEEQPEFPDEQPDRSLQE